MLINKDAIWKNRGQLSIIIVVAIVIIAGIALFFILRNNNVEPMNRDLAQVYQYYASCIEQDARAAIDLAGTQGGHIFVGPYIPGSEYAPFSNQFNFFGFAVPYWYYISGNGIIKEQIPKKAEIEKEMANYIKEKILECDFESFYSKGYDINLKSPKVDVSITESFVQVKVDNELSVKKDENSAVKNIHQVEISSKFGKFFRIASEIYDKEKNEAFLENYSADVLRLYAPVDGVEISCSPKIWKSVDVVNELKEGLEANIAAIKFDGDYYDLSRKENSYFVVDKKSDEQINLIYSKSWPTKVNIEGDGVEKELMIARPIGNQGGLGMMGFCYAPYHFIYDLSFPVLVQVYNDEEIFQFPVVVIIDKNMPRKAEFFEITPQEESADICEYKTQSIEVSLFDIELNNVEGKISFECLDQECELGETKNGVFVGNSPACVNGYLKVKSEGFAEKKELFSSNTESSANIILDREYSQNVTLFLGNEEFKEGSAIIVFTSNESKTTTIVYPETKNIKLSEGEYEVKVYAYGNSSLSLPESKRTQCTEVPRSGLAGFFGSTKEECFDITIPATKIEYALVGGGALQTYLLPSELESGKLIIKADKMSKPSSIEELQNNFISFDTKEVSLEFS